MNESPFQALDSELATPDLNSDKLYVTEEICESWRQTSRWTMGLAIIGFVSIGIVLIFLTIVVRESASIAGFFSAFLAVFIFIIFVLARNLYRYAVRIRKAANSSEWDALETAFSSLSNAYTIYGFFTMIVALALVGGFAYYLIVVYPTISNTL